MAVVFFAQTNSKHKMKWKTVKIFMWNIFCIIVIFVHCRRSIMSDKSFFIYTDWVLVVCSGFVLNANRQQNDTFPSPRRPKQKLWKSFVYNHFEIQISNNCVGRVHIANKHVRVVLSMAKKPFSCVGERGVVRRYFVCCSGWLFIYMLFETQLVNNDIGNDIAA